MARLMFHARKIWYGLSLRSKLTLASLFVSLVPFFILALSASFIGQRFASHIVQERNQYLAQNIAARIDEKLAEKVSTLKLSALSPAIQSMNRHRQESQLATLVELDSDLLIALTMDRDGQQVARSDGKPPDPTVNYSDRGYFSAALTTRQTAFSDTQASRTTGILSIAVAQPILDDHSNPQGLLLAAIDLQKLIDLIQQYPVGETGVSFLINSSGNILYHPSRNIGEALNSIVPEKMWQSQQSGAVQYELNGKKVISGFAPVKHTGWLLVVRQPLDEAMEDMLHMQKIILLLFLLTAVLSVLMGRRIAQNLSRPIADVAAMAEKLAKGELNASIWVQDTAELRELAAAFNNMSAQIQNRQADLIEREQHYRSVVDHLNIGLYRKQDDGSSTIEYANPALPKIFGCASMAELLSPEFFHFLMAQKGFRDFVDLVRERGHVKDQEIMCQRRDGSVVWCLCTATRYHDAALNRSWIDASFEDITDRKLASEKLQQAHDCLERKVQERTRELEILNEKLRALSLLDGLTGIANRRYFDEFLLREWQRAKREQLPVSMLLLDVDHFKLYNDTYGHIAGDECLKQVAATLNGITKRATDLAARFGGEEFALILPNISQENAMALAYKLLSAMEALHLEHRASPVRPYVTVSIGCATVVPDKFSEPETILLAADQALYLAKQNGRNQVQCNLRPVQ